MFKIIALAVLVSLIGLTTPLFAEDGNNVPDQLGDIFSGKGQTYGGVEIIKDNLIKPFGIPLGIKVWADCLIGEIDEGIDRDFRGGIRLRIKL